MIEALFSSASYNASRKMLDLAALQHQATAANLANLETPGYQRVRVSHSFEAEMRAALRSGDVDRMRSLQPALEADTSARAVRPDGNNVQIDQELLEMNRNAINYQFFTQKVSGSIRQLKMAITGNAGS